MSRWNEVCIVFKMPFLFLFSDVAAFFSLRRRGPLKSDQRVRKQYLVALFLNTGICCLIHFINFVSLALSFVQLSYTISVVYLVLCPSVCFLAIHSLVDLISGVFFCSPVYSWVFICWPFLPFIA